MPAVVDDVILAYLLLGAPPTTLHAALSDGAVTTGLYVWRLSTAMLDDRQSGRLGTLFEGVPRARRAELLEPPPTWLTVDGLPRVGVLAAAIAARFNRTGARRLNPLSAEALAVAADRALPVLVLTDNPNLRLACEQRGVEYELLTA